MLPPGIKGLPPRLTGLAETVPVSPPGAKELLPGIKGLPPEVMELVEAAPLSPPDLMEGSKSPADVPERRLPSLLAPPDGKERSAVLQERRVDVPPSHGTFGLLPAVAATPKPDASLRGQELSPTARLAAGSRIQLSKIVPALANSLLP